MSDGANGQGPAPPDEFDRALRELTEGRAPGARFHEPSAAERARESAARAKKARKEAARSARQAARRARQYLRTADGGRGGHRGLLTGSLIVLVVVVIAGGLAWMRFGRVAGGAADIKTAGARGTDTITVTGPASGPTPVLSPADLFNQPPRDPFTGTDADGWANGAAGIVAPRAEAMGPFTAAQVAFAYATTKKLLIAAALDRATLLGGNPAAFARLLTARQRAEFLDSLAKTGLDSSGNERNLRSLVASFAPGGTALIGSVIKVRGSMSAAVAQVAGGRVLDVSVDYRFVYPVEPPGLRIYWKRVIAQFTGVVRFSDRTGAAATFAPWVNWRQSDAGVSCYAADGFIHPDYPNRPSGTAAPSGAPVNPYAPHTHPANNRCWSVTST